MESPVDVILLLNIADELSDSANEDHFLRTVSAAVRSNSSALAVAAAVDGFVSKENPCRIVDIYESTIPTYSDGEFKCHFRMLRSTTEVNIFK